jgi:hypothetical protein
LDGFTEATWGPAAEAKKAYQADLKKPYRSPEPMTTRSSEALAGPERLNLSAEDLLEGIERTFELQELEPTEGVSRARGVSLDGHLVAEFRGALSNVSRAELMVSVEDLTDEELHKNAVAALRFVKNAIPRWKRDADWLANQLKAMSQVDVGRGEIPAWRIRVTMDFVKPLGAVRFTIERQ